MKKQLLFFLFLVPLAISGCGTSKTESSSESITSEDESISSEESEEESSSQQHTCVLTKVNGKQPTCTEGGNSEYYECTECHKLYSDCEGKNPIASIPSLSPLGHDYVEDICSRCGHRYRPIVSTKKQALDTIISGIDYSYSEVVDTSSYSTITPSTELVEITVDGSYYFSGDYTGGVQVANTAQNVSILLDNANISITDKSAVDIKSSGKVHIYSFEGTDNAIRSIKSSDKKAPAISSAGTVYVCGEGSLSITTNIKAGVEASGGFVVDSTDLSITAANHCISATFFECYNCSIELSSSKKDGINVKPAAKAYNLHDGYVFIKDSSLSINVAGDGIESGVGLFVDGSTIEITTNGTFVIDSADNRTEYELDDSDFVYEKIGDDEYRKMSKDKILPEVKYYALTQSCKGIKNSGVKDSSGDVVEGDYLTYFKNSTLTIDSTDDSINSKNGHIYIHSGTFTLSTHDDGISCEGFNYIAGGTFTINSYEGIESVDVEIAGGTFTINTYDDVINASSDNVNDIPLIHITGGTFTIVSENGDGLDANGNLWIEGGNFNAYIKEAEVLDCDISTYVDGGNMIAATRTQNSLCAYYFDQKRPTVNIIRNYYPGDICRIYKNDTLLYTVPIAAYVLSIFVYGDNINIGDTLKFQVNDKVKEYQITEIYNEHHF